MFHIYYHLVLSLCGIGNTKRSSPWGVALFGTNISSECLHYSVVTLTSWRLGSPTTLLFAKKFVHANIKGNTTAPHHWPPLNEIYRSPDMTSAYQHNLAGCFPSSTAKMAAISQTIISDAFLWMKSFVFWLKFHWSLFPRVQLTIIQHCLW